MVENVTPKAAWQALQDDPQAQLVDVRTDIEWNTIGVPDLSLAEKQPKLVAWQMAPSMQVNAGFVAQMQQVGLTPEHHIYYLCRSGVRSLAAGHAAIAAGFPHAYNILDGFEGPPDQTGQRGHLAGWQADALPWRKS